MKSNGKVDCNYVAENHKRTNEAECLCLGIFYFAISESEIYFAEHCLGFLPLKRTGEFSFTGN